MRKVAIFTILALLVGLMTFTGGVAYAEDDLEVDINDPDCDNILGSPFCDIQPAVNATSPGDEIEVNAGTYSENVTITKADIELEGEDAILDGTGLGGSGIHVKNTSGVQISGFIVENFDKGILLENVYHSEVSDVETRFNDNVASPFAGNGLDLVGSDYNSITEVFAHDNGHNGITLSGGSANNTLDDNTTNDNGMNPVVLAINAGCGIQISRGGTTGNNNNTITDNESLRNGFGILVSSARDSFPGSSGNIIEDNDIHENLRVGIDVQAGSSGNFIIDNDATGNINTVAPFKDLVDRGDFDNTWEDNKGTTNF